MTNVWRLENVCCFIKIVVQEDIFDFQFMKAPWFWQDNTEHSANDSRFDYEAEFFTAINTCLLVHSITYKKSFVPLRSIWILFMLENPQTLNNISIRRRETKPHILFTIRVSYLSFMTIFLLGSCNASIEFVVKGNIEFWDEVCKLKSLRGLTIPCSA